MGQQGRRRGALFKLQLEVMETPTVGYVTPDMYKGLKIEPDRAADRAGRSGATGQRRRPAAPSFWRLQASATMPSLTFVLPHWLYWAVLVLFPLVAMYLVAREQRRDAPAEPMLFIAYLFW